MKQAATLKEIAKALNMSVSTVSRALKNNSHISPITRRKVQELARALEYEPNNLAVQLRTNTSKLLGIIVPSISSYFYNLFIAAVEEQCNAHDYSLLVLQSNDNNQMLSNNLFTCRQNRVSGILVCADVIKDFDAFFKLKAQNIPVIFFDKIPDTNAFHKVGVEDEKAAMLTAEKILAKNKKNILALFGNLNLSITVKRLKAFKQIIQKENKNIELHIETDVDAIKAKELSAAYILNHKKLDCIFCMSDEILTGTMHAVQQSGKKYPGEIGIIAISHGFFPSLYFPQITYAETNGSKLGNLAFKQMMACLKENKVPETIYVESVLIEGGSL